MLKYVQLVTQDDLSMIMNIIGDAKKMLKDAGSSQWQGNYPSQKDILNDINNHYGYVFIENHEVAGYAAVIVGAEPTYQRIDGQWANNQAPYATIHRICLSAQHRGHGLASSFMSNLISLQLANHIHNFRIDTTRMNMPMQKVILNCGFTQRGIIQVVDDVKNPERLAYELNL